MKLNKSLIAIALAALPVSNFAMAETASNGVIDGRIELRIPIAALRSQGAAPSEWTEWTESSARTNHTEWEPAASNYLAQYSKNKGRVLKDSGSDTPDADFAQQRKYDVSEIRYEQRMAYDGDGEAVPDGKPIKHERDTTKTEYGLATVNHGEWIDQSSVTCTEWNSVGSKSRYLTPWTETADGQERTCEVAQTQNNVIVDSDKVQYPYSTSRVLYWIETSAQKGLLDNRSCKTLREYYNANKSEIVKADSSYSYNGWKQLNMTSSQSITTYCANGYTMVAAQFETNPVPWTGGGFSNGSDLSASFASGKSFAFDSSFIPSHSKFGVGSGGSITITLDTTYSTGNIHKSANGFTIHRSTSSSYLWHNPRSNVSSSAEWRNTLTVENSGSGYGSSYDWAFSPNAAASCSRGYALNGYRPHIYDNSAWTIFVY